MRAPLTPALVAILAGVVAAWAYVVFGLDLAYWYHDNEIAELSAGYALNIDQWLAGSIGKGRRSTFGAYTHPGLWHQLASWLAYRLSDGFDFSPALDLARATLANPGPFFLIQRLLVLALFLYTLWRWFRIAQPLGGVAAAAIALSLLIYQPVWEFGVLFLDNPSLAPILGVLFFGAILGVLDRQSVRPRDWLWLGFMGAAAYSLKMQYIAWIIAALGGVALAVLLGRLTWKRGLAALLWIVGGFALGMELLALLLDGKFTHKEIVKMLAFHASILAGGQDANMPAQTAGDTAAAAPLPALVVFVLMSLPVLGMAVVAWQRRLDNDHLRKFLPVAGIIAAILLAGFVSFLMFPSTKYLMATAALIPAAWYWLLRMTEPSRLAKAGLALLLPLAVLAGAAQLRDETARAESQAEAMVRREKILALPLAEGEERLWAYRVLAPEYNIRLALQWSGIRDYDRLAGDHLFPKDREFNIWRGEVRVDSTWFKVQERPWRHAVLPGVRSETELPVSFRVSPHKLRIVDGATLVERP